MKKSVVLLLCAAAVLAACGGGDDKPVPAATAAVPDSASQSAGGFISYLQKLVASGSAADTLEPVDVSAVTPPADNSSEPTPVD
jgi:hypothetical protein